MCYTLKLQAFRYLNFIGYKIMQSMFKRTPILQQLEDNETDIYFTAIDSSLDYSVPKFEKETNSAPKKYPLSCTELEFDLKSDDEQKEGSVASSDRFDELEKNVSIRITNSHVVSCHMMSFHDPTGQ